MKRFFCILTICIISLFTFAGCGLEGANSAAGIEFVQDIFYVDYNVPTYLEYKVYPGTAENVYVNYGIENDSSIDSFFNFSKGSVQIINEQFTSIKVSVKLNEFTDVCEVKLRKYPKSISFKNATENVNAGSVFPLQLMGVFDNNGTDKQEICNDKQYKFKLESSNPSIVEIISEEDLLVKSTGRSGSVKIYVQIYDSINQVKTNRAEVTLNIVENINSAFVRLGSKVIKTNSIIDLSLRANDKLELYAMFFDDKSILHEITDFEVYLTSDIFTKTKDENKVTLVLKDIEKTEENEYYSVMLTVHTTALDLTGKPFEIKCEIRVRVS